MAIVENFPNADTWLMLVTRAGSLQTQTGGGQHYYAAQGEVQS